MNRQNNFGSLAFWGIVGGIIMAITGAVGACYNGEPTKENIIEVTRIVPVEVTRLVEVTPVAQVVVKAENTAAPGIASAPISATSASENATHSVTKEDITYRLDEVTLEGEDMTFWIIASNKGDDKQIEICYSYCHVVDAKGNDHQNTVTISGDVIQGGGLIVAIRGGINTRFGIKFTGMSKVKSVQRLDVSIASGQLLFALMLQDVQIPFKSSPN